jgi:hypothetical protein
MELNILYLSEMPIIYCSVLCKTKKVHSVMRTAIVVTISLWQRTRKREKSLSGKEAPQEIPQLSIRESPIAKNTLLIANQLEFSVPAK